MCNDGGIAISIGTSYPCCYDSSWKFRVAACRVPRTLLLAIPSYPALGNYVLCVVVFGNSVLPCPPHQTRQFRVAVSFSANPSIPCCNHLIVVLHQDGPCNRSAYALVFVDTLMTPHWSSSRVRPCRDVQPPKEDCCSDANAAVVPSSSSFHFNLIVVLLLRRTHLRPAI